MKNGDPRKLVMGGKKATVVLDRFVGRFFKVLTSFQVVHHFISFGQTPWLMDIIWKLPGSASMHYLRGVAAQMMRTRVQASNVRIRDLASYLVRWTVLDGVTAYSSFSSQLDGHPRTGQHICLTDLELDAIVTIQGGSYTFLPYS